MKFYYKTLNEYILNSNNQEYTNLLFDYAIKKYDSETINKLLDNKINITQELFIRIVQLSLHIENGLNLIKKSIINGGRIEKTTIKSAIEEYNKRSLLKYNSYYGINNNCNKILIFLFENGSTDITFTEILKLHIYVNINSEFINYLIDNNVEITKREFIEISKKKIKINNIKKIEHFLSDTGVQTELYNLNSTLKYPMTILYTLDMLKKELRSGNTQRIKEMLKKITPTQECLEIACNTNNITIIQLLHGTYGLKFNEKCILNHSAILRYNTLLNYVRQKYINKNHSDNNYQNNNAELVPIVSDDSSD